MIMTAQIDCCAVVVDLARLSLKTGIYIFGFERSTYIRRCEESAWTFIAPRSPSTMPIHISLPFFFTEWTFRKGMQGSRGCG
ncbi:hypothetical protein M413DRAFT_85990 [Hebeloma cylindrosporum]|uniref:Uncharacterized protein n=1 Tax=Hebeloma cylindrosporum TaxID=76867 RepID=A0A0C2Z6G4_HEBCY|nr:hypothetical protein M413DRAFT_85990 [Hebeloma cylindrosporum h7]